MTWTDEMLGEDNAEVLALERKIAAMQVTIEHHLTENAEKHAVIIGYANAMLAADMRINRAINLCEFILSGTGPDEATAQERTLARSVLIALRDGEVEALVSALEAAP